MPEDLSVVVRITLWQLLAVIVIEVTQVWNHSAFVAAAVCFCSWPSTLPSYNNTVFQWWSPNDFISYNKNTELVTAPGARTATESCVFLQRQAMQHLTVPSCWMWGTWRRSKTSDGSVSSSTMWTWFLKMTTIYTSAISSPNTWWSVAMPQVTSKCVTKSYSDFH